ncbi:hypothetical protein RJ639_036740, partial [Escallonia herrerae]
YTVTEICGGCIPDLVLDNASLNKSGRWWFSIAAANSDLVVGSVVVTITGTDCDVMSWLVIIFSVFVLWVASLCRVFNTYCSSSKATFLSNAGPLS